MWLAELLEPILRMPGAFGGTPTYSVDRLRCRYFLPTASLGEHEHAMAFWSARSLPLTLPDAAAAQARAEASDTGVHFSFEKEDRVTRSTIRGRLGGLFEKVFYRGQLVAFSVPVEVHDEARRVTSGGGPSAIESEDEEEEEQGVGWGGGAAHVARGRRHWSLLISNTRSGWQSGSVGAHCRAEAARQAKGLDMCTVAASNSVPVREEGA